VFRVGLAVLVRMNPAQAREYQKGIGAIAYRLERTVSGA